MRASGCGGGNTGKPDSAKTFLPEREKISTPVAASFNLNGRDVNIYEYTGLTFNNQSLWTKSLAVTDDTIYFFGTDRSDPVYQTKLRSVHYKGETLSDLKDLDPQADMRDHLMISNGLVYEWRLKGDYKKTGKKGDRPSWHYYDGTQVVPTDLKNMIASIDGSKDVIYDRGKEYWTGTLDKGTLTPGRKVTDIAQIKADKFDFFGISLWADKDGMYIFGTMKNDKGESYNVIRQFSLKDGSLLHAFEGPLNKNSGSWAVTGHCVVLGEKGGTYWVYNKQDGTLMGKGQTKPALTPYLMVPMKNDSILIYREVSGTEVKLYRMDL